MSLKADRKSSAKEKKVYIFPKISTSGKHCCAFSLALGLLELVGEGKLGGLLLQLGKLVLVLAHLLQGGLDELALHVAHGDGQLVDLKVAEDDLALQEEHLALQAVPLVKVLLADLLEVVRGGCVNLRLGAAALGNNAEALLRLPLLFLLELLGRLLAEEGAQLLLPLGGHESLLLGHGCGGGGTSGSVVTEHLHTKNIKVVE